MPGLRAVPLCLIIVAALLVSPFPGAADGGTLAMQDTPERTGEPWNDMDYGPFLSAVIEVTPDNIAPKGIAVPLD